ncbi:MAG: N-acetyltransferase family protein [Mariprofundus sp.]
MRLAEADDLVRIVEIYNATIASRVATADLDEVSLESKRAWFESHSQRRPIFVKEVDGHVAGWASFENFYGRPAFHMTAELSIYVDQAYRGRGIGFHMLEQAIGVSPSLGLRNLLAFIYAHNRPSIKLFEKGGFLLWGKLPAVAEMDGHYYDVLILGLDLPDSDRV